MYNLLMNEHKVDEALEYIDPNYGQHNVRAPDGKEFLRGAFKARFAENPKFRSDIKRTVADGDLVVVHTHERFNPTTRTTSATSSWTSTASRTGSSSSTGTRTCPCRRRISGCTATARSEARTSRSEDPEPAQ